MTLNWKHCKPPWCSYNINVHSYAWPHHTTSHITTKKPPLPLAYNKICKFSICNPTNSFCVTSQVQINIRHVHYIISLNTFKRIHVSTYSISIWLIQRAFLSDLVQFHIDLLGQDSDWISSQACDHHCTQISNIVGLTECSNPSSHSVLQISVFLLLLTLLTGAHTQAHAHTVFLANYT